MINLLKLIRLPNLIIIAFIQILMRYGVMLPVLKNKGYQLQMSGVDFLLLVLSTIFLAAAGYVINDYFDRKSDMINNPTGVIVEKRINRRWVMFLHVILNFFGVIIGIYLTIKIGNYKLSIIYLIIPALLWYYSTFFKNKLIVGNLIVASFIAIIPLLVPLIEFPLIRSNYQEGIKNIIINFNELFQWITAFSVFSFLMIVIYNSAKEIVNIDGDRECNRETMPIVFGLRTTKIIVLILSVITIILSAGFLILNMYNSITIFYYLLFIIIPFSLFIIVLLRYSEDSGVKSITVYPRIIMLFGMLYTLILYYILIIK